MSSSRKLVFVALAAGVAGVFVAVTSALGSGNASSGSVAAAQAVRVKVNGAVVTATTKPSGAVCFSAPHVSGCAASVAGGRLAYATGSAGSQVVLAGLAGPSVKAVIARLTHKGTVWPTLRSGAFYVVLPHGYRLTSIVKVLDGGRRVAFRA